MKARIIQRPNNSRVPQKIIEDKQYAREFWEHLVEGNPDGNYGASFDEWYERVRTLAFVQKMNDIQYNVI